MSRKPGTPIPASLDSVVIVRPVSIDRSLLYLIGGALEWLVDYEPLEQTGSLTVAEVRTLLSEMLWNWYNGECNGGGETVVGTGLCLPFAGETIPAGFLLCDGAEYLQSAYPDLYAQIGTIYGGDATHFNVPDMTRSVPIGYGGFGDNVGDTGGEEAHSLSVSEMPFHNHGVTSIALYGSGGGNVLGSGSFSTRTSNLFVGQGANSPHNNMPPYVVMKWVIKT